MQTVILAGGLATRLRPLTEKIPKSMIPIHGKPFLEYQIELLKKNKITDILLCIGYLGDQIKNYFGDGERCGVKIRYSEEKKELLDTGGALKNAEEYLAKEFFLLNGDTYLPINYPMIISYFRKVNENIVVVYNNSPRIVEGNIALRKNNLVSRYEKGASNRKLKFVDAGVQIFKREILGSIKKDTVISLEKHIFPKLIAERQLMAFVTKQRFYDIGTLESLKTVKEVLE